MILPHTVTVYNVVTEEDALFQTVTTNYITILRGVLVDETKGRNVRESGLETADAVILHIPRNISAVDAETGETKTYVEPVAFFNAENKTKLWTLSVDAGTFFVKGEVIEPGMTEQYINLKYDGVYTVSSVDNKDFGGLAHWEIGGRH